jgi:tetratricopeptide (TPR) repeat protein
VFLSRIATLVAAAACLAGAVLAARLAGAAWWGSRLTAAGLERAAEWTPEDPDLWRRRGMARPSRELLERAAAENPRDALAWIELGLLDEAAGRSEDAERKLREAVRRSRRYVPRWTLANFYFRAGREAEFWREARAAAAITFIDPAPLYRLCWRVDPDGERIRERVVPAGSRRALADFVTFLLAEGHVAGLSGAARALAAMGDPADGERLRSVCDRLIAAGRWEEAWGIWAGLTGREAGYDGVVQNGTFRHTPGGQGFDWRVERVAGYAAVLTLGGLRLTLDGTQPAEGADLLRQALILPSGTKWRLTAETTEREGAAEVTDLYWRITDPAENGRVWAVGEPLPGSGRAVLDFEGTGPAWLILAERRKPGRMRWEGSVTLKRVEVAPR